MRKEKMFTPLFKGYLKDKISIAKENEKEFKKGRTN